jgi:hypothetical protein
MDCKSAVMGSCRLATLARIETKFSDSFGPAGHTLIWNSTVWDSTDQA